METLEKIKIFDLKFDQNFRKDFYELCEQVFDEAYLTNHTMVNRFEDNFSSWTKCQFNVAVNNGTSALAAALLSLDLPAGSEVIIPTNTFISCWYAALRADLKPVLIDIDSSFLGIDIDSLKQQINSNTKAIIITHIGGLISNQLPEIKKICTENNIYLIEDCAHAVGSNLNGVPAGAWGDVACFSFHLTKTITGGEGGLVCTNSSKLFENLISIRQFGMTKTNPHQFDRIGFNTKMTEIIAAFLLVELKRAPQRISRRRQIAEYYFSNLKNSKWQLFCPESFQDSGFYKSICQGPIAREKVQPYFTENSISLPNGVYFTPLHQQPIVKKYYQNKNFNFKNSNFFSEYHFCLPCYPELTNSQISHAVNTLLKINVDQ